MSLPPSKALLALGLSAILSTNPTFAETWKPLHETDDFGESFVFGIETTSIKTTIGHPSPLEMVILCPAYSNFHLGPVLALGLPNEPSLRNNKMTRLLESVIDIMLDDDEEIQEAKEFFSDAEVVELHVKIDGQNEMWTGFLSDKEYDIESFSFIYPVLVYGIIGWNTFRSPAIAPYTKKIVVGNEGTPITFDVSGWETALKEHCSG